jgi:hypothetical protein
MSKTHLTVIVTLLAVMGALAILALAIAQGPGGPVRTDPTRDDTTRPRRQGPPIGFDMGDVISTDAGSNTLVIGSMRGGENRTVKVAEDVVITRRVSAATSDLLVGETIAVRGTPTELIARTIESADEPEMLGPSSPFGGAGGRVFTRAEGAATGKIVSTNPLTLEIDENTKVVIQLNTKDRLEVSRTVKIKLGDLKPGEFVSVRGNNDEEGNMTATSIAVTPERRPPSPLERGGEGSRPPEK